MVTRNINLRYEAGRKLQDLIYYQPIEFQTRDLEEFLSEAFELSWKSLCGDKPMFPKGFRQFKEFVDLGHGYNVTRMLFFMKLLDDGIGDDGVPFHETIVESINLEYHQIMGDGSRHWVRVKPEPFTWPAEPTVIDEGPHPLIQHMDGIEPEPEED